MDQLPDLSFLYLTRVLYLRSRTAILPTIAREALSDTQWWALLLIDAKQTPTAAALARELGHDPGALTRLLDQLVSRELIRRDRDTDDRRTLSLSTTSAGSDVVLRCLQDLSTRWSQNNDRSEVSRIKRQRNRLDSIADLVDGVDLDFSYPAA